MPYLLSGVTKKIITYLGVDAAKGEPRSPWLHLLAMRCGMGGVPGGDTPIANSNFCIRLQKQKNKTKIDYGFLKKYQFCYHFQFRGLITQYDSQNCKNRRIMIKRTL